MRPSRRSATPAALRDGGCGRRCPASAPCLAERRGAGCADGRAAVSAAVAVLHPPLSGQRTTTGYTPLPGDGGETVPSYCTIALPRTGWEAIRATATEDFRASEDPGDGRVYQSIVGLADHALENVAGTPAVLVSISMAGMLRTGGYYAAGPGRTRREPRTYLPEADDRIVHEWLRAYRKQVGP
ncbi:hypothetical protein [Streptomyces sp. NPDC056672]|uniref:hypothetical protein n=1 Tax=Streptomyces sp. NPDC056672 TaxID=3345906 RepID=UPI0036C700D7